MRRHTARHPVSLSSWILQPRAHDSESGQLPALSSRTLLWEREADQSVWKMQGWSVKVSLFISTKDSDTAWFLSVRTLSSVPAYLSLGAGRSVQSSLEDLAAGNKECTLSTKHHSWNQPHQSSLCFSSLYTLTQPFQQQQQLLDNSLYVIHLCAKAQNSLAPYANPLMHRSLWQILEQELPGLLRHIL